MPHNLSEMSETVSDVIGVDVGQDIIDGILMVDKAVSEALAMSVDCVMYVHMFDYVIST